MSGRPLEGRVVVLTRRPEQSAELRRELEGRGAIVLELPAVEVAPPEDPAPLDAALRRMTEFAWVAFTSATAVRAVAERLVHLGLPPPVRGKTPRIAAVGEATAREVREAFPDAEVDLQPEADPRAEGLVRAFSGLELKGAGVLLPVSSRGRRELEDGLRQAGAVVERVVAYGIVAPTSLAARLQECLARGPDLFVFASPSAVQGLAGPDLEGRLAVVIGPTTEAAAREAGLRVGGVAATPDVQGMVEAVMGALSREG